MKTLYEAPKMEIVNLNQADIITTSTTSDNDTNFSGPSAASLE